MLATVRHRRLARSALTPPLVILSVFALLTAGVIDIHVYTVALAAIVFFLLGRASVVLSGVEHEREAEVSALEAFIASAHQALASGQVPDEQVEAVERDIARATEALGIIESLAPWHVRWRQRRAREKASR